MPAPRRGAGGGSAGAHDLEEKVAQMQSIWDDKARSVRCQARARSEKDGAEVPGRHRPVRAAFGCHRARFAAAGAGPRCARHDPARERPAALCDRAYAARHSHHVPRRRPAWLCRRGRHQFSAGHRAGLELGSGAGARGQRRDGARNARARRDRGAHARGGCGARSALGPHRGNLRRRSVSRRRNGRRGGRRACRARARPGTWGPARYSPR